MPSPPELEKARKDRGGQVGGQIEGRARIVDPEVSRIQALQMLQKRVDGQSYAKIGEEMNVSGDTVKRRLEWAKKQGLLAAAEERIVSELVPAAINAFKSALDNGMYEAARDVLFGTGLLSKNPEKAAEQVEMTLTQWREDRKNKIVITTSAASGHAEGIVQALGAMASGNSESLGESGYVDSLSPFQASADPTTPED